jgi:transaldolase
MELYIDIANPEKIEEVHTWGIIDGVTMNPSTIAKEGSINFVKNLERICAIIDGPIHVEVISQDSEGMIKEARELSTINKNIYVKIPATKEGVKALRYLQTA